MVDYVDGSYVFRAEAGARKPAETSDATGRPGDDGVIEGEVVEVA
jgi:hypothetical protein